MRGDTMTNDEARDFVQSQLKSFKDIYSDLTNIDKIQRFQNTLNHIFTVFRANNYRIFDDFTGWTILGIVISLKDGVLLSTPIYMMPSR